MYQRSMQHPLSATLLPVEDLVFESMWELFTKIGTHWKNMNDPSPFKSRLFGFMLNRIKLDPLYGQYYSSTRTVINELKEKLGEEQAYLFLFTDGEVNIPPPETLIAIARQKVANEFMALQLSLGGFKAFGARNYNGYIGGANIPGRRATYRTFEDWS